MTQSAGLARMKTEIVGALVTIVTMDRDHNTSVYKHIYFVRHGETDLNAARKIQGGGVDSDINEHGRFQSKATGELLAKRGFQCDLILVSTLKRTIQTAEIVAESIGYCGEMRMLAALNEQHKGNATEESMGAARSKMDELSKKYADDPIELACQRMNIRDDAISGVTIITGYETEEMLAARVMTVAEILADCDAVNILVVCHCNWFRAFSRVVFGVPDAPVRGRTSLSNGFVSYVVYDPSRPALLGKFVMKAEPTTDHIGLVMTAHEPRTYAKYIDHANYIKKPPKAAAVYQSRHHAPENSRR